jgi:hypothetical protein
MANPPTKFVAVEPIDYPPGSGVWAFQPGDPVHPDYVDAHGLLDRGLVQDVEDKPVATQQPAEPQQQGTREVVDYNAMTVPELDELLEARGLDAGAGLRKADKVILLEEDDKQ